MCPRNSPLCLALGRHVEMWLVYGTAYFNSYHDSVSHTRKWRFREIYSCVPSLTAAERCQRQKHISPHDTSFPASTFGQLTFSLWGGWWNVEWSQGPWFSFCFSGYAWVFEALVFVLYRRPWLDAVLAVVKHCAIGQCDRELSFWCQKDLNLNPSSSFY